MHAYGTHVSGGLQGEKKKWLSASLAPFQKKMLLWLDKTVEKRFETYPTETNTFRKNA